VSEIDRLLSFARQESIDLSVVGPDDALAAGIVDLFEGAGLRIFGPTREAAQLESSKSFAKEFMVRHGIPTARFRVCASPGEANAVLGDFGYPVAVKADGLALGKGVVIAHDRDDNGAPALRGGWPKSSDRRISLRNGVLGARACRWPVVSSLSDRPGSQTAL
jgi:phosphoribosylamine--glycine ligase